jgi:hypothetical protein
MSTVRPPIDLSPDDRAALTMMLRHSFPDAEIDEAMLEAVALAGFLDESSGVRLDWDRYRGPLETHAAALELSRGNGSSLRLRTRASEQQQQQRSRVIIRSTPRTIVSVRTTTRSRATSGWCG